MALTLGSAPLVDPPAGDFNFDLDLPETVLYMEDVEQRVRVYFGGEKVADSRGVRLLHRTDAIPTYYFPVADVRTELLDDEGRAEEDEARGVTSYRTVVTDDDRATHGAWLHPKPPSSAGFLADRIAFDWNAMDAWFEEEDEVVVHPKDPYHRVDVLRTTRAVEVSLDDVLLARTRRALMLLETGLPPRYYIPGDDVVMEHLEPSDTHSRCPYKGVASYYSVRTPDGVHEDLVWYYPDPYTETARIQGLLAFYNERVDLTVDGTDQERPVTHFT